MKKIVQYVPFAYQIHSGGLEKIAQTLHKGLQSDFEWWTIASNISTIGSNNNQVIEKKFILQPSIEIIHNYPIPCFRKKQFWVQYKMIKSMRPDVIITHTRFFFQSFLGGIVAKLWGCKRVHIEHGSSFVKGYSFPIIFFSRVFDYTLGLRIFRQCDTVVTISAMHKRFISKFTNKNPLVVYNPIDYIPLPKVNNTIPHIGFVGRLVPLKGVDLLINALAEMKQQEWICTIVGDGSERLNLERLTKKVGLQSRIHFVGPDDRANRLHKFDIFVNPSHQEGVPTTVIEALIAQCLVVATDVGGTSEITDKEDLCLIPSGESKLLTEKITYFLHNKHFSGYSLQEVKNKFSPSIATLNYYNCIMNL